MQYQGGKAKLWPWIVPHLRGRFVGQPYLEPFVGGAWVMANFTAPSERYAGDSDADLIELWQAVQKDWMPPKEVTEDAYHVLKMAPRSALKGFVKFGCSWRGKPWGGFARSGARNYAQNASNSIQKKRPGLSGVKFFCKDYREWNPQGCLIYCDPPYENTTGYAEKFDWPAFWSVMRDWTKLNRVLISSYEAPDDFQCVSEFTRNQDMRFKEGRKPVIEKLFTR